MLTSHQLSHMKYSANGNGVLLLHRLTLKLKTKATKTKKKNNELVYMINKKTQIYQQNTSIKKFIKIQNHTCSSRR